MQKFATSLVATAVLLTPGALWAHNRQDLQIQADLRQLSEQVNRLQLTVNQLAEQVKTTNSRLDAASDATMKASANQQAQLSSVSTAVGTLRENMQDNTVRVSQLTQEFGAVRSGLRLLTDQLNALVNLIQPVAPPENAPAGSAANQPGASAPAPGAAPLPAVSLPSSPATLLQSARNDYSSGRYDLAIEGFQEFLETFPTAPEAASAQFEIGESYYQKKMCQEAIPAYQKVVDGYRSSDVVPDALLMLGVCSSDLGRRAQALAFYERVIKDYPDSTPALVAKQRLDNLQRR